MFNKTLKIIGFVLSIAFLALVYQVYKERTAIFNEMPKTIENFEALNTDKERTHFFEEKGRVTLIILSASWCPACLAEMPALKQFHQDFSERGLKILMISEDDNLKTAAAFKKKHKMPWTVLHWNYDLMNMLGNPRAIPFTYLIDKDNNVKKIVAGIFDKNEMYSAIEDLLR